MAHTVASRPVPGGETWARSALWALTSVPGVHRAGLALTEGAGRRLLFTANDRDNDNFVRWCEIDPGEDVPLNHTVRTGHPVTGSPEDLADRFPVYVNRQAEPTQAIATQPIVAVGHVLGGYVLYFDAPQAFDSAQHRHLGELGALLGQQLRQVQRSTRHANRSLRSEPIPDGARVAIYRVASDVRSVAGARHWAHTTLKDWGANGSLVDNAVLCLNELVTNAVLHTHAGCEARLMLEHGVLTVTVRDEGSAVVVDPSHVITDPLAVHGRGLQLVAASASRWGSELDACGMTVWFTVEPATASVGR